MEEIIYFEVNNWCPGEDYPTAEPFYDWLGDDMNQTLRDDDWAKENKLCIGFTVVDMSFNYTVAAPRSWVEENCPVILEEPWKSKFCFEPEDDGECYGNNSRFLLYCEENFGVTQLEWE